MPDEFPEGFAHYLAERYAENGEYEKYLADEFPEGMLYVPSS